MSFSCSLCYLFVISSLCISLFPLTARTTNISERLANNHTETCYDYCMCNCTETTNLNSPMLPCNTLPSQFIWCDLNDEAIGCKSWGAKEGHQIPTATAKCRVLDGITCCGSREFLKPDTPCIKYTGKRFPTTIIFSVFLGWLGVDRFYLGHTGIAVGKLLTIGGVGVWWFVDLVLLIVGQLRPHDGSFWEPIY